MKKGFGMKNLVSILKGKHKDYKELEISGIFKDMKINDIKNYIFKVYYYIYIDNKMVKGNDMATYYCINREGLNWFKKIMKG